MTEPAKQPNRQISNERKVLYYAGMALSAFGFILFFSVFVSGCVNFGNFDDFEGQARGQMARAFGGMALMIIGGIVMRLGVAGLAGSGAVLDPQRARKDLEPWARMGGGLTSDALSEVEVVQKIANNLGGKEVVKVRCRKCQALNPEESKFCNQCGAEL